jgi:hypothetical protein
MSGGLCSYSFIQYRHEYVDIKITDPTSNHFTDQEKIYIRGMNSATQGMMKATKFRFIVTIGYLFIFLLSIIGLILSLKWSQILVAQ